MCAFFLSKQKKQENFCSAEAVHVWKIFENNFLIGTVYLLKMVKIKSLQPLAFPFHFTITLEFPGGQVINYDSGPMRKYIETLHIEGNNEKKINLKTM